MNSKILYQKVKSLIMQKIINLSRIFLVWSLLVSNAYAYVDPGSGMLLWQGLVAFIGAVLIFFRNPINVIKSWIDRIRGK